MKKYEVKIKNFTPLGLAQNTKEIVEMKTPKELLKYVDEKLNNVNFSYALVTKFVRVKEGKKVIEYLGSYDNQMFFGRDEEGKLNEYEDFYDFTRLVYGVRG